MLVDALDPKVIETLPTWVDELAAPRDGVGGVLQHREGTDSVQLCRTENFTPVHHGMRQLLCEGAVVDVAGALLGDPSALQGEGEPQAPGGAGYAHQGAGLPDDRHPRVGDDRGRRLRPRERRARSRVGLLRRGAPGRRPGLHRAGSGCTAGVAASRAPQTLWFHSRTPHRSGPNRSSRAAGALPDLQRAGGDRRRVLRAQGAAFASAPGDRARVSLIGDFEGRSV